jgi:hypothetical protein
MTAPSKAAGKPLRDWAAMLLEWGARQLPHPRRMRRSEAMSTNAATGAAPRASKAMLWAGWVISALPVLGLVMSAVMKFKGGPQLEEGLAKLDWPVNYAIGLGILELSCTVIYVIPQTAVLGAILLTGYMGGAIATHVRIGEGFVAQATIGVLLWLGLFLRDARLRELLPLRRL